MKNVGEASHAKAFTQILIVEPNDTLRTLYGQVLRKCSYAIYSAATYEEALGCLPAFEPHLILLSLALPDNGTERISERVRSCANLLKVPIICTTSGNLDSAISRASAMGIKHFLQLPFEFSQLRALISQLSLESSGTTMYSTFINHEKGTVYCHRNSSLKAIH